MATKYIKVPGKIAWANTLRVPDTYNGAERYTCQLYPTEEGLKILKDSGCGLQFGSEKWAVFEGEKYVKPRRDAEKIIKNEVVTFGPPKITMNGADYDGMIGNGSVVEASLAIYDAGRYKGHRLESIRILDLIEYERPLTEGQELDRESEPEVARRPVEVAKSTETKKPRMPF